jgi:hypothetical protein
LENPDSACEPIGLQLSADEALVLFELLSRFEENDTFMIADPTESHALSRLLAQLEKRLVTPFDPRYAAFLAAAQARLRALYGDTVTRE